MNKQKIIIEIIKKKPNITKEEIEKIFNEYSLTDLEKENITNYFNRLKDIEMEKKLITNRIHTQNFLNQANEFYKKIATYPVLSHEEVLDLFERIKNQDNEARNQLINCNLRLVLSIARKYDSFGLEFEELVEYGILGLMKAIEIYDPTRNIMFSTYATYWIKQRIVRAIKLNRSIHVPVRLTSLIYIIREESDLFMKENKHIPSDQELFEIINKKHPNFKISFGSFKALTRHETNIASLNSQVNSEDDNNQTAIIDVLRDFDSEFEDDLIEQMNNELIKNVLNGSIESRLKDKEKNILWLRYGFTGKNYKLDEIGEIYNLTRERIRQIETTALRKLKKFLIDNDFLVDSEYNVECDQKKR